MRRHVEPRLGLCLSRVDIAGEHEIGGVQHGAGLEHVTIDLRGVLQRVGREMRGEGVGQAQMRRQLRAVQ